MTDKGIKRNIIQEESSKTVGGYYFMIAPKTERNMFVEKGIREEYAKKIKKKQ